MELSRRTFTALAGTAALGLALAGSGGAATGPRTARVVPTGPPPAAPGADGRRHRVGHDRYSLLVDGRRLVLWSAEVHYFRLPSPSLWRDVLQKLRALGHNAITVPVAWNHHSPAPGVHDFTGVRDLDLFLRTAAEERLYVVLRPGPRLETADLDGGGLPGWLSVEAGRARAADPAYLRHADAWLSAVDAIAVRHLYTAGGGTVLLYEVEDAADEAVREHLARKVLGDRIDVPLLRRGGGLERLWVPEAVRTGRPDAWGGQVSAKRDARDVRRTALDQLADGVGVHTLRMGFGGTSWGWLPGPGVCTSYDYGAPLDEARRLTPGAAAGHQLGHLLRTVPDLARLGPARRVTATDERLTVRRLSNPDTGARFYVVRNDSAEQVTAELPDTGIEVPVTVAAGDTKLLASGVRMGHRKVAYTTAQPMMSLSVGRQDIAVFAGRKGETAQLALDCETMPTTTRMDPEPAWSFHRGRLTVVVPLGVGGPSRVLVEGGDSDTPMLLVFADDATALRLWPRETPSGSLLVYGPALLREATVRGSTLHLTGDVVGETGLEVWAPRGVSAVTWNGQPLRTRPGRTGSLVLEGLMPAAPEVALPVLDRWRRRTENPEARPDFDDSDWPAADRTSSRTGRPVPEGGPVLFADDYGFHYGDVWYRGRFEDAGTVESVALSYAGGAQGLLMAWLDGEPLGTHRMPGPDAGPDGRGHRTATARFEVPGRLRTPGTHVLSVLVRPMQRAGEEAAEGASGAARGLMSVEFKGAAPSVSWRIQGAAKPDRVRGPLNNGGLYGERRGWHLPGYGDGDWKSVKLPREREQEERRQGVTWYRTRFRLSVPKDVDTSVGLVLNDDPERAYRVQVFLNGWNLGQYINDVGPQHTFVLPNGILRTRGSNTLALAVLADGTTPAGPGEVRLTLLGTARGGVPVTAVESPGAPGSAG